jgi:hypothetical protein
MTTTILLLAAAGASGLLAGASLDQSIKQLPARRRIGVVQFSRYSQAADLSNGVAWYASLGIGTAVLTLAAAIAALLGHPTGPSAIALWVALGATMAHSLATARAAPINFRQRELAGDEAALSDLFDRFERWHTFRAVCQVVALIAVLAALAAA